MGVAFDQLVLPRRQFQVIQQFRDALAQSRRVDPMEFADEVQKLAAAELLIDETAGRE